MTKKTTKRALWISAVVIVLCVAMFVGSTFAWFTDSVTSGSNIIKSGTLDVDLVDVDGNSMAGKVIEFVDIDDNDLWEPGCKYITQPVQVVNKGNLALQYEIVISGIEGDAKLLEVIDWTVMSGQNEVALAELKGVLLPGEDSDGIALVGHMQESAGNEYQNLTVEGISITVNATQYTYESDSFNNTYDEIAMVGDAAALKSAVEAGGNVVLTDDIDLDVSGKAMTVAADKKVIIDLNGNDIIGTTTVSGASQILFEVKGELTVIGDGTVALYDKSGAAFNQAYENAAVYVNGGVANLNDGTIVCTSTGEAMAYAADAVGGNSVINVNGATLYSSYIGIRSFPTASGKTNTINYNSGVVYGGKNGYDIWTQEGSGSSVVNIADGIDYTREDQWGGMYYVKDADVEYVSNATGLASAIENGGDIVLMSDVAANDGISIPAGVAATLDLNGHTLSAASDVAATSAGIANKGDLTIKNGTVEYISSKPDASFGYGTNTITNSGKLVIDNATIINNTDGGSSNAIDNAPGSTLVVNSGVIQSKKITIRLRDNSDVTIYDAVVSGSRAIQIHLFQKVDAETKLTIKGGTFTGSQMAIYSVANSGSTFSKTTVNISGGTFNGDVAFGGGDKTEKETVNITGGTFNGYLGRYLANDGWEDIAKP